MGLFSSDRSAGADSADAGIWRTTRNMSREAAAEKIRQIRDDTASGRGTNRGGFSDEMVDAFVDECNRQLRDREG